MTSEQAGTMTPDRFAALAQAYGADFRRWPEAEQEAARRFAASGEAPARRAIALAASLDDLLASYRVPAPSHGLYRRIVGSAPVAGVAWTRARLWWSGLGLAGVGLAGVIAGASAIALVNPTFHPSGGWTPYETTAFGDLGFGQDG